MSDWSDRLVPPPSLDSLRKLVSYDPATGFFTSVKTGKTIGHLRRRGDVYLCLIIGRKRYAAHRIAWYMMTGDWPLDPLDHVNRNGFDNRFSNLRIASFSQNRLNTKINKNNTSGFRGVSRSKHGNWEARIMVDGVSIGLGTFPDKVEAYAAYVGFAREKFGDFANV